MIWFKERVTITTMYKQWIWKNGVTDTPISLISFLQIKYILYQMCLQGRVDKTTLKEQFEDLNNVMPIVRCKDCKHWDNHDGGERCLNEICLSWAKPENFCNYGERKE